MQASVFVIFLNFCLYFYNLCYNAIIKLWRFLNGLGVLYTELYSAKF